MLDLSSTARAGVRVLSYSSHSRISEQHTSQQTAHRTAPRRSVAERIGAGFVAMLACVATLAAQGAFHSDVRVINHATQQRHEWALATVPFPEGEWTTGKRYGVRGVPSEVVPFGAPWPDGSIRFGQLAVRADLQGQEERLFRVEEITTPAAPFTLSPWVQSRLPNFDLTFLVGVPNPGGSPPTIVRSASLRVVSLIEDTPVRKTYYCSDRIQGTQLVYDFWLTFFADQDTARFEARITSSMVGSAEWEQPVDWILMSPRNAVPIVHGRDRLQAIAADPDFATWNPVLLLGTTTLFDGQGHEWFGSLAFLDPAVPTSDNPRRAQSILSLLVEPLYGMATNWPSSGAYGPFGYLPAPPPWITDGGRAAADVSYADFRQWYAAPGEIWEDRPLALREYPAVTGTQHDFGVGKFVDVFVSGMPQRIEEIRYMAGEEAYRPIHHREPDGRPLKASDHPDWVARSGRTHWSPSVSRDRLGKPTESPNLRDVAHGWFGKDHEHWSSLVLSAAYLLTGSHSMRMELDNDAELFLASHTVPSESPGNAANSIGNGRALGRVMLTMAWNALLTGRNDVVVRMRKRLEECVVAQHFGLANGGLPSSGLVLPLHVIAPDPRSVGSGDQWVPWQEAQAALGVEAAARVCDSTIGHLMAYLIARNLVMHGWRVDFENTMVAYSARYLPGGTPIPVSEFNNPEFFAWPTSPASFNIWSLPATRIAIEMATRYGDTPLLQRASFIAAYTERLREWPRTGAAWDSYADWDCVR